MLDRAHRLSSSWSHFSCNQTPFVRKYIFIIFAPFYVNSWRQNRFKCYNLHDHIHIFLDNGVMTTPKRRILSFVFTVLCNNNNNNNNNDNNNKLYGLKFVTI